MENNKQIKLHSPGCMENNRQMKCILLGAWKITYLSYTNGIKLHLFVIFHTPRGIQENNKQMKLYSPVCLVNNKLMKLDFMGVW
jgi:hypothetical protein